MTTDPSAAATRTVTALIAPGVGEAPLIAETLLSLAAQTSDDFDVMVIVDGASEAELDPYRRLVATFDASFSERVRIMARPGGTESPLCLCASHCESAYLAVIQPEDVVFAHWAETFAAHAPRAGQQAMTARVATQAVERQLRPSGLVLTSVGPPRPEPAFDLATFLAAPSGVGGGTALPRRALVEFLPSALPAGTEEWTAQLLVYLVRGHFDTGEVTYLRRVSEPPGAAPPGWAGDRADALHQLDQRGLSLAPGVLVSLLEDSIKVAEGSEERELLAAHLAAADEVAGAHAAAEVAARQRVADLQASASWKVSAPLRLAGRLSRRRRPDG